MRWMAVVLLGILIVGLTWWKVSSRKVDESQSVSSDFAATPGPAEASRAHGRSPNAVSASDVTPQDAVGIVRALHDTTHTQATEVVKAGHDMLFSQYQSERVDAHWAHEREQSLVAHSISPQIQDLKVEPKNMTVHCRSTTCAIAADFPTRGAADDWLTLYATNTGTNLFNLSSQVTANPDGSAHIQIYGLAKQ